MASSHTSKKTKKFLEETEIELLPWFSKGADMNIIEHVCAAMKNYLEKNKKDIKCKEKTWEYAKEFFFSDECLELIKNCY